MRSSGSHSFSQDPLNVQWSCEVFDCPVLPRPCGLEPNTCRDIERCSTALYRWYSLRINFARKMSFAASKSDDAIFFAPFSREMEQWEKSIVKTTTTDPPNFLFSPYPDPTKKSKVGACSMRLKMKYSRRSDWLRNHWLGGLTFTKIKHLTQWSNLAAQPISTIPVCLDTQALTSSHHAVAAKH